MVVSQASLLPPPPRTSARKSTIRLVSQNARGLKSEEKMEELTLSMKARGIFASCIQETWRSGKDTVDINQCKLVFAGLDVKEQRSNRGSQGVGIVLSSQAVDAWRAAGCELHNDLGARIIAVRLLMRDKKGKDIGVFLISAYAPIGIADENLWRPSSILLIFVLQGRKVGIF